MPPLPKKKHTRARKGWRRKQYALSIPTVSECPECGSHRFPHRACSECGYYNGRLIPGIVKADDDETE